MININNGKNSKFNENLTRFLLVLPLIIGLLAASCSTDTDDASTGVPSPYAGKLLILQVYGSGPLADGAVSHNFVELYNNTNAAIPLDGISLQYADGYEYLVGEDDGSWNIINLAGTIPPKSSFLVLGEKHNPKAKLQIEEDYGDMNLSGFELSNRSFKVALIQSQNKLTVENPFNTNGKGAKVSGYIDMVGAINNKVKDMLNGYETEPTRTTKQSAIRRKTLSDTDSNMEDFQKATYNRMLTEAVPSYRPRNAKTPWDRNPMDNPAMKKPQELMIFQVYGGIYNGTDLESACSHAFVELYNNSDEEIDLSDYSLHYATGGRKDMEMPGEPIITSVEPWDKIELTGKIPAKSSFLIRGAETHADTVAGFGRLQIDEYNMDKPALEISNRSFKIALMLGNDVLSEPDPGNTDDPDVADAFVDLIGATNNTKAGDFIDASLGKYFNDITKNKAARRRSLNGVEDNNKDFVSINYRDVTVTDLDKFRPRTASTTPYKPKF